MKYLVPPSRCTAGLPDNLELKHLIGEEKLDGSRYMLYLGCDPYERQAGNALLSRRISVKDGKHVDRTENVPQITGIDYNGLSGTVIDGEIMATDFLGTNSIMNSGPALAVQKQEENGFLNFNIFDVPIFRGNDIRGLPLTERRKVLLEVAKRMGNENIKVIPQITTDLASYFKSIVNGGGEGLIIKDIRQGYGCGWAKMKKSYDVSVVISGWKPGKSGTKYESQIGSLALSIYKDGGLVEIGFCSGFDDALRKKMSDNFSDYKGKVIDIFAHEIQKGKSCTNGIGRLRHATFHRFRDDVSPETITTEKLKEDLETGARSNRSKWRSK